MYCRVDHDPLKRTFDLRSSCVADDAISVEISLGCTGNRTVPQTAAQLLWLQCSLYIWLGVGCRLGSFPEHLAGNGRRSSFRLDLETPVPAFRR
jgi:hypothetical protein